MGMSGLLHGLTQDMVLPREYLCNGADVMIKVERDTVAHSHRVGFFYSLQPDLASYFANDFPAVCGENVVKRTCGPNHNTFHIFFWLLAMDKRRSGDPRFPQLRAAIIHNFFSGPCVLQHILATNLAG